MPEAGAESRALTEIVDVASAREFTKEALGKISEDEIVRIVGELQRKSERFRALLGSADAVSRLAEEEVRVLLRSVFATRRRGGALLTGPGPARLRALILPLLHGAEPVQDRLQAFCEALDGVDPGVRLDLAGECLHYTFPQKHWLWTRWMWDPETGHGALRIITMDGYDLGAPTIAATYLRVGEVVALVNSMSRTLGFRWIADSPFGADVYLVCIYGVYLYTTVRLRMTQEFNKVMPQLPELARRLLGVHRPEL